MEARLSGLCVLLFILITLLTVHIYLQTGDYFVQPTITGFSGMVEFSVWVKSFCIACWILETLADTLHNTAI